MKLRTLVKIEFVIRVVLFLVFIPFIIIELILTIIREPFSKVTDSIISFNRYIGNKLLRCSDEVKNGVIKNNMIIRTYSASFALKQLNIEKKEESKI